MEEKEKKRVMWKNSWRPKKRPSSEIIFQLIFYKFYYDHFCSFSFILCLLPKCSLQTFTQSRANKEMIIRLDWAWLNDIKWIKVMRLLKSCFPMLLTAYMFTYFVYTLLWEIRENRAWVCYFHMDQNSQYTLYTTAVL